MWVINWYISEGMLCASVQWRAAKQRSYCTIVTGCGLLITREITCTLTVHYRGGSNRWWLHSTHCFNVWVCVIVCWEFTFSHASIILRWITVVFRIDIQNLSIWCVCVCVYGCQLHNCILTQWNHWCPCLLCLGLICGSFKIPT